MVAPIQLNDEAVRRAYLALSNSGEKTIDAKAVDKLIGAARSDDGKIDATESADLARVLQFNSDSFTPEARSKLKGALSCALGGAKKKETKGPGLGGPIGGKKKDGKGPALGGLGSGKKKDPCHDGGPALGGVKKPEIFRLDRQIAPADNTRVVLRPIGERRETTAPNHVERPIAPADATHVHVDPSLAKKANPLDPHGFAAKRAKELGIPENVQPRQHFLSQADPKTLTPEYRARVEAERRHRESVNNICNLDPTAAQINGMWQAPTGNWTQVGPSPLEMASQIHFAGTIPGRIYGGYQAVKSVAHAVEDPSASNVALATFKVGLSGFGEYAKVHHLPIKPAISATKGTYNAVSSPKVGEE